MVNDYIVRFNVSMNDTLRVHIIEGLQQRCSKNNLIQNLDEIALGDRVKIESGPFANFICTVEKIKDEQRAWVLIDILQEKAKSEISLDNVSKIN